MIIGITVLMFALSLSGMNLGILQWIPGILLAFVFPGYAIRSFLIKGNISLAESFLLSLGISLTIDIFAGLLINITPWGLRSVSWSTGLGIITIIASLIALINRREKQNEGLNDSLLERRMNVKHVLFFSFAIIIVIGAFVITRNGAANQNYPGFTQLWMLPVTNSHQDTVKLGVTNNESSVINYILELYIGDQIIDNWNSIQVKPGEQWETTINLPPQRTQGEIVEAVLFLKSNPNSIYRWAKFTRNDLEKR